MKMRILNAANKSLAGQATAMSKWLYRNSHSLAARWSWVYPKTNQLNCSTTSI